MKMSFRDRLLGQRSYPLPSTVPSFAHPAHIAPMLTQVQQSPLESRRASTTSQPTAQFDPSACGMHPSFLFSSYFHRKRGRFSGEYNPLSRAGIYNMKNGE